MLRFYPLTHRVRFRRGIKGIASEIFEALKSARRCWVTLPEQKAPNPGDYST